jgi:hypothetical protein
MGHYYHCLKTVLVKIIFIAGVMLMQQISLRDLTLNPVEGLVYCLDIDNQVQYQNIYLLRPTNLPEAYIPDTDSYYDLESELEEEQRKAILSRVLTAANAAIQKIMPG